MNFYKIELCWKNVENWHMKKFFLLSISEEQALERISVEYELDLSLYKISVEVFDPMEIFEV